MFITLEGGDGSGKTTQIVFLMEILDSWGVKCLMTKEPGGTLVGRKIRSILLDEKNVDLDPKVELLLYMADRIQHIRDVVQPAINAGVVVVCDRFYDSTIVYQGLARGLDISIIQNLHKVFCGMLMPDITFLMCLDPEVSIARTVIRDRSLSEMGKMSRFEQEKIEFHKKVQDGYLELARLEPNRFFCIDASLNCMQIKSIIKSVLEKVLLEK